MTSTDPDRDLVLVEFHFHELVLHLWAGGALDPGFIYMALFIFVFVLERPGRLHGFE